MKLGIILHLLGVVYIFLSFSMLFPLFVSLYYGDGDSFSILLSAIITFTIGVLLFLLFYKKEREINHKEGFLIVALAWASIGIFGALPYIFSGVLSLFIDAYFESISGFTTIGASVFSSVEELPHGILLWRSLSQWLGGMGIILLSIAILPLLGVGGMQLYKAESSGVRSEKLKPRIAETAKSLWYVYLVLTIVEIFLLYLGGVNLFDAINHSFATLATGGFSTKNLSINFYNSPLIEIIIIIFMLLSATNFTLHYNFITKGNISCYTKNSEIRLYYSIILLSIILVALNLVYNNYYQNLGSAIRHAAFNTVSIATTTGFASADFAQWPYFSQSILVFLMLMGGSVGSTAGGIKMLRIAILIKLIYGEFLRLIHPHAVVSLKINNKAIPEEVLVSVIGFTSLYVLVFIVSSLLLAFLGLDIVSAFSSVATTLGGTGPGLSLTGPLSNYGGLPYLAKVVLIVDMLLGRLEIYTILILLTSGFWKR